jgi:hypothetical protein
MFEIYKPTLNPPTRPQASKLENTLTVGFGLWLIIGFFVDGYAHGNLAESIEDFFTPWHAILYSGFFATALWVVWLVMRRVRQGMRGLAAIPLGYDWALVGAGIFGVGGLGDLVWHTVFGIEVGVDALRSPSHLLLYIGASLLITAPLRSMWQNQASVRQQGFWQFLPIALVVLTTLCFTGLLNIHFWGLSNLPETSSAIAALRGEQARYLASSLVDAGVLLTNAILMSLALGLLWRWRTPFGVFAIWLGLSTAAVSVVVGQNQMWVFVAAAALAGLMMDALVLWLDPHPSRVLAWRCFAAIAPLAIWGLHFLAVMVTGGIGISLEMWTGTIAMTVFSSLGLGLLSSLHQTL